MNLLIYSTIAAQSLIISNIKTVPSYNKTFSFTVTNKDSTAKSYIMTLEFLDNNGSWYDVDYDLLSTSPSKSVKISTLSGTKSNTHKFLPSRIVNRKMKNYTFRIKLQYGNNDANCNFNSTAYSTQFTFN